MSGSKLLTITGGEGRMGRRLIRRFLDAGYEVRSVGLTPWTDSPGEHIVADLRRFGDAVQVLRGSDVVIHLAADSGTPAQAETQELYDNVATALNVFLAADQLDGVRRVVWASSTHAIGQPFSDKHPIATVPALETDFYSANDLYGLSKRLGEAMIAHRAIFPSVQIVAIRVSFQYEIADYPFTYEAPSGQPYHIEGRPIALRDVWNDTSARKSNLWGYVDGRDVFQAFRLAVESSKDLSGEILHITAADTIMNVPTRALVQEHYPNAHVADDVLEYGSFYSISRAKDVLGYEPEFSWRSVIRE